MGWGYRGAAGPPLGGFDVSTNNAVIGTPALWCNPRILLDYTQNLRNPCWQPEEKLKSRDEPGFFLQIPSIFFASPSAASEPA